MRVVIGLVAAIVIAVAGIVAINAVRVHSAAAAALEVRGDISAFAYYRHGLTPGTIVFDLWDVGPGQSQVEVIGALFAFSREMKDREFEEVRLAYRGEEKFLMSGRDFAAMGRDFLVENPLQMMAQLPTQLRSLKGGRVYLPQGGGLAGMARNLENVTLASREWYLDDYAARLN